MATRVSVPGELFAWARERSRVSADELTRRYPQLPAWEHGVAAPTLKQLERFAAATHTPVGYFFLPHPPVEELPLPDFRTLRDQAVSRPSPDLLDTIVDCQRRQEWYRDHLRTTGADPVEVAGELSGDAAHPAAASMRSALNYEVGARGNSWAEAFRRLADNAEELGVLVMVNGVVGSNTHRKLDPQEFRGFALADEYAPVVFVNGADTKAAQIFTLAHELAHIWLGESGVDNPEPNASSNLEVERWCSQVAAELLVPEAVLGDGWSGYTSADELDRLAARFRVSTLVVLRRLYDTGELGADAYRQRYAAELDRVLTLIEARTAGSGGNFYNTQPARTSRRFARALVASTLEGQTLYRDAFQMLGFKKRSTFDALAERLGVA
jgi:Zn-dependent peptidase ImmA (M78 family)